MIAAACKAEKKTGRVENMNKKKEKENENDPS
jgi:hypothetical protein